MLFVKGIINFATNYEQFGGSQYKFSQPKKIETKREFKQLKDREDVRFVT